MHLFYGFRNTLGWVGFRRTEDKGSKGKDDGRSERFESDVTGRVGGNCCGPYKDGGSETRSTRETAFIKRGSIGEL